MTRHGAIHLCLPCPKIVQPAGCVHAVMCPGEEKRECAGDVKGKGAGFGRYCACSENT